MALSPFTMHTQRGEVLARPVLAAQACLYSPPQFVPLSSQARYALAEPILVQESKFGLCLLCVSSLPLELLSLSTTTIIFKRLLLGHHTRRTYDGTCSRTIA
jgi:hypothetical protein